MPATYLAVAPGPARRRTQASPGFYARRVISSSPGTPSVSVIIRAKDREALLDRAIASVRAQTVPAEVIVVDSGSRDRTVEIARRSADRVIEIPAERFSFGRALNIGAAASVADVHVALSSHCALPHVEWLDAALAHYSDPSVAATNSSPYTPHGTSRMRSLIVQREVFPDDDNYFGFSNHAATWRADVWRRFPFAEEMIACEDKEWATRVRRAGFAIVFDPYLYVPTGHRRGEGVRALYRRVANEAEAIREFTGGEPVSLVETGRTWWTYFPARDGRPSLRSRVSPLRAVEIGARWAGERRAVKRGGVRW